MKKTILTISFILVMGWGNAQNLVTENFDTFPASWTKLNVSNPVGGNQWGAATTTQVTYFNAGAGAYNGVPTSFGFVNFNSTTGAGDISNWLISPVINLMNGDVISFYTIKGLSGGTSVYADNMQVRLSTAGAASVDPVGSTGVGSYTTLMHDINPGLITTGYPTVWTQYNYTVTGLSGPTDCRVAFRYVVPNAGPLGANSDQIAIDQYTVDRTLGTDDFFRNNFTVFPNPATDLINITSNGTAEITKISISDLNGRIVKETNTELATLSVGDLNAGVYFLKINTIQGVGTTKIIKK